MPALAGSLALCQGFTLHHSMVLSTQPHRSNPLQQSQTPKEGEPHIEPSSEKDEEDDWGVARRIVEQEVKPSSASPRTEPERDLFIPIFTLVAIAGFTGAYGYEMLRLYSRGELYLPF